MRNQSKVNLSRPQLLKLLKANDWDKCKTAALLGVGEASVRRACKRHNIDCELEKKSSLEGIATRKYRSRKSKNSKKINKGTFVIIPDLHADTVIWNYLATVCEFIKDFAPSHLIQLGDLVDYECLLGTQRKKYPSFDAKDFAGLDREFQACAKILTMLNEAAPKGCKKYFLKGNHEYRADQLVKRFPEFDDIFNIEKRLDLSDWNVFPYLQKLKLGKLNVIHGEFYGQNPVRKHLQTYQKNVVFGHTHAIGQETLASPMREIPIWGAMLGCICTLNADYMRNKSSRAEHGFGYGSFCEDTGDFDCRVVRIIKGHFWAEGKWWGKRDV